MPKVSKRPVIVMPTVVEDKAITATAMAAPNALSLAAKQLQAVVPMRTIGGRPKSEKEKLLLVSVRFSPEVI